MRKEVDRMTARFRTVLIALSVVGFAALNGGWDLGPRPARTRRGQCGSPRRVPLQSVSTLGALAAPAALVLYALVLVPAVVAVWRRPVLALYAFVAGLALYDLSMALLYGAGVHGAAIGGDPVVEGDPPRDGRSECRARERGSSGGCRSSRGPSTCSRSRSPRSSCSTHSLPQGVLGGDSGAEGRRLQRAPRPHAGARVPRRALAAADPPRSSGRSAGRSRAPRRPSPRSG